MPKNVKGGNKTKKQKNNNQPTKNREIPVPEESDDSHIAIICKVHGDSRYLCNIVGVNGLDKKEIPVKLSPGIKNKYGKGVIVTLGTYILISIRSFQQDKGDIIFIYRDVELNYLIENNHMILVQPNNTNSDIIFANFDTTVSKNTDVANNSTENNTDVFDFSEL